ncbi:uncharacterized protein TNCV_2035771 [Trichonephila clavipes]|nr:uncharacterized protein TNCV_2035771 [Trichonephila clavipes]
MEYGVRLHSVTYRRSLVSTTHVITSSALYTEGGSTITPHLNSCGVYIKIIQILRIACEIKLLESEATTGFFVLLGEQENKAVLDWVMKEGFIPSRYECPKCKKDMRLVERKGTIDGFEWRCRVQSKGNPHFVCRSISSVLDDTGRPERLSSSRASRPTENRLCL